jgi:hypothetical protein
MMSRVQFEEFRRLVLDDTELQELLHQEPEVETYAALVARLGLDRGFAFTSDDVSEAMQEARRAWLERWIR